MEKWMISIIISMVFDSQIAPTLVDQNRIKQNTKSFYIPRIVISDQNDL